MPPDARAEMFAEWVESHEDDLRAEEQRDVDAITDDELAEAERLYYEQRGAA